MGTAYLGAWVRPLPVGRLTPVDQELSKLPSFNSGLGRSLSVVHVYQDWAAPTSMPTLQKVLASGCDPDDRLAMRPQRRRHHRRT